MFTPRMFDMWTSKLEPHNVNPAGNPMQTNVQTTNIQNSSTGSIKGKCKNDFVIFFSWCGV